VRSIDKLTRFGPFSSQCRGGNVKFLRGPWNEELFRVLEGFPDLAHDDEIDACSGALEMLNPQMKGWGIYEFYRQKAEQLRAERKAQDEATCARVRLRAPPGIGSVQTFSGRRFRLERLPGGACTHWKAPPCHGAHPKPTFVSLPADRWVYWGAVIRNRPAPAHRYAGGGHHARPCRTSALGQGAAARPSYRGLFHLRISGQ
jgi:hypothetical protein